MIDPVLHSSKNINWETPKWFFNHLNKIFDFELDPCCSKENALCPEFFTQEQDGLAQSWANKRVFMNPPYGRGMIDKWVKKAHEEAIKNNAIVVALLPARTDPQWFWVYCKPHIVYFLSRRLKFNLSNSETVVTEDAPFPSMLVVFSASPPIGAWNLTDDAQVGKLNYCNIKQPATVKTKGDKL